MTNNYPDESITNRLETPPVEQDAFRKRMREQLQARIRGDFELPSLEQEQFGALDANDSRLLEVESSERRRRNAERQQRSRQWREEPKPSDLMAIAAAANKAVESSKGMTDHIQKVGEAFGRVKKAAAKKEYLPLPRLTYRPFHTLEMVLLRDQLRASGMH